ncbi:hypothetical protein HOY82DRAFT_64018 [Tuber indicum]|nr:hypothetical protein HOY82DRAFT_64018 [Tuber indicum]
MSLMMAPLTATLLWSSRCQSVSLASWPGSRTSHNPHTPPHYGVNNKSSSKTQRVNIKDLRLPPSPQPFPPPPIEFFNLRLRASTKRTAISLKIICRIYHLLLTFPPSREEKKKKTTQIAIHPPTDIRTATRLKTQLDTRYFFYSHNLSIKSHSVVPNQPDPVSPNWYVNLAAPCFSPPSIESD